TRFSRDWSSDVCSSDLLGWSWASGGHDGYSRPPLGTTHRRWVGTRSGDVVILDQLVMNADAVETGFVLRMHLAPEVVVYQSGSRSEERRVGKEGRDRWR